MFDDTIAALSTPPGSGGIGVVRVSGDKALSILNAVFRRKKDASAMKSHTLYYGVAADEKGEVADEVLACYMKKPATYTREDVVEIHCHGGSSCVAGVLRLVLLNGARPAEPGEFTKRAFINGRIDLSRAEAVMDVISAKTDLARRAAINRLQGSVHKECAEISTEIVSVLARVEASIDYPEHDLEEITLKDVKDRSLRLIKRLDRLIDGAHRGRVLQYGVETAIVGKPNVGKSSLLNFLLGEDRAIVSDTPGTTRDAIQECANIKGVPLRLADTAGIRETTDEIERMGVEKALRHIDSADLLIIVLDGSSPATEEDISLLMNTRERKRIVAINKSDLPSALHLEEEWIKPDEIIKISLLDEIGANKLLEKIKDMFFLGEIEQKDTLISGLRAEQALRRCRDGLCNVVRAVDAGLPEDFCTIDLRESHAALGEITGETTDDAVIDKIFSEFCVGK
ncbi:MAG: tRNA uridine-5-carboxymethylaminomethyl(34) synthesis GTPase MnmE [Clostridiales bacterium]|jgi:tRNA modification GTPase|nr:tRNA uridine-5-carboxymethylaminomethyl(34) synthesis GTPase MnmE [Clostridiales bacterium]